MKDINGPVLDLPSTLPGPNKIYNRSAFFYLIVCVQQKPFGSLSESWFNINTASLNAHGDIICYGALCALPV